MADQTPLATIAIIGGGFTGAAVALHLVERFPPDEARIIVFEPRERLGAGLAYDTADPVHRINVPAARMSIYPDDPEDFSRWLEQTEELKADPQAFTAEGVPFPRRQAFGLYIAARLAPFVASGAVEHWRSTAVEANQVDGLWTIRTGDGRQVQAHGVVLAVSHPAPSLPASLRAIENHPGLVADATRPNALAKVSPQARVLVVGNGLTAADVIASMKERGHRGSILSISRRGLRSRGHPSIEQSVTLDLTTTPSQRASHLLNRIRRTVREANAAGLTWHPVLDAVRAQGQEIWKSLPVSERRRIARHIRPFWDVHRFRIAPQVEKALDDAIADGSLTVKAASLRGAEAVGDAIRVILKERGSTEPGSQDFDTVIVTTGPAHGGILQSQPLLASLAAKGRLALCPTGLGLLCDRQSRALAVTGGADDTLLIAGPLARGTFGELMGLPQVSEHALFIAEKTANLIETRQLSCRKQNAR